MPNPTPAISFDQPAAIARVQRLMAIPGKSGQEAAIMAEVTRELRAAGLPASALRHDDAHKRSPHGGEIGNLIVQLPGTPGRTKEPRRLLMAHVDTVPVCVGSKPIRQGGWFKSADKNTGLGADNRGGATVVLTAALEILRRKLPHPPLTFFWPVQEEVGLTGARHVRLPLLGKPKLAFNFDGGSPAKMSIGATGAYRLDIHIRGIPSHAGVAPHHGVNAITIAALAIAELERGGWLGLVRAGKKQSTSNIGYLEAGGATNVVTPTATLRAEVRSHNPRFRNRMRDTFIKAFQRAAQRLRNEAGEHGDVKIDIRHDYESFELSRRDPSVQMATAAIRAAGGEPIYAISNGGLDANWMLTHGIPTVTLGCGQHAPHMTTEMLNIHQFTTACEIGLRLATRP